MNQLDRFRATVAHEPHESLLYYAHFTPAAEQSLRSYLNLSDDTDLFSYFEMFHPVEVTLRPPEGAKSVDFSRYFADIDRPDRAFINHLGVLEIPGSLYHFTSYTSPLRHAETIEEVLDFPYPNVDRYTEDHMAAAVKEAHRQGKVTSCSMMHMYEDAWQIRGYEPFLMDMISQPDICEYILDQIMHKNLLKAEAAARAGVDLIISGDDVASQRSLMFAPDQWRHFIKQRWARVYAAARKIKPDIEIWYHSDGNIMEIIPELIEIGVTILNPVQPECLDLQAVKQQFGRQIVMNGTIGTQTTMPFGSVEDVRKVTVSRKKEFGYDGALILSPTHVLEPEVPPENMVAFFEACRLS